MKILLDATVLQQPATGIAKATLGLYNSFLSIMPNIISTTALHRKRLKCDLPLKMDSIQRGTYIPDFLWRRLVFPILVSSHQPSIVHFPWNGNVVSLPSRITVVTTIHDVLPLSIPNYFNCERDEQIYRNRLQKDIDRTHLIITDSEYSKKEIMNNFDVRSEPVVIYLAPTIKLNEVGSNFVPHITQDYFLYVGGYDSRKGIESLLNVFIKLHREKKLSSKLILTGSKHYFSRKFKKLIEEGYELGIVEEMGYVPDSVLANLYTDAKALIYPSKYEGFGLPPLEAMAMGCPVITTKYTSIPEVCGEAVYYIEPDDEKNFADGLILVENSSEFRAELKMKGKKQAAKFTWVRSGQLFLDGLLKLHTNRK
jgi:glycosyltransferase involved in cell wall biosynthesis